MQIGIFVVLQILIIFTSYKLGRAVERRIAIRIMKDMGEMLDSVNGFMSKMASDMEKDIERMNSQIEEQKTVKKTKKTTKK